MFTYTTYNNNSNQLTNGKTYPNRMEELLTQAWESEFGSVVCYVENSKSSLITRASVATDGVAQYSTYASIRYGNSCQHVPRCTAQNKNVLCLSLFRLYRLPHS